MLFILPLQWHSELADVVREMLGMGNTQVMENRRILVVDDNPSIHQDFKKILTPPPLGADLAATEAELFGGPTSDLMHVDFKLDFANTGEEALKRVEHSIQTDLPYAIAFVDMRLGAGWDGIQTICHLWETDARLQVVICSAYSDHSWKQIVRKLGLTDRLLILKKPFSGIEILQMALALSMKWSLALAMEAEQASADHLVATLMHEMELQGIQAPPGLQLTGR